MNRFSMLLVVASVCATSCLADEAENIPIVTSMVRAINERNLDQLDRLIAPDFVRHSAATAGVTVTSLAEFKTFLRSDLAAVPDSVMKIDFLFGNDQFVAMRAIYSGTQTGALGPFPASGKRVELPFIGILKFTEGKISEMWVEWDNVYAWTQLGHISPPADN
jgi:steroid delta-isomerase-like uncharacterized protein